MLPPPLFISSTICPSGPGSHLKILECSKNNFSNKTLRQITVNSEAGSSFLCLQQGQEWTDGIALGAGVGSPHRGGLAPAAVPPLPRAAISGAPSLTLDELCSPFPQPPVLHVSELNFPFSCLPEFSWNIQGQLSKDFLFLLWDICKLWSHHPLVGPQPLVAYRASASSFHNLPSKPHSVCGVGFMICLPDCSQPLHPVLGPSTVWEKKNLEGIQRGKVIERWERGVALRKGWRSWVGLAPRRDRHERRWENSLKFFCLFHCHCHYNIIHKDTKKILILV